MFLFLLSNFGSCDAAFRQQLKDKYRKHKTMSYKNARIEMYNNVDCENNQIHLIYGGNTYSWTCGGSGIPSSTVVNAEHIVPQSFFNKKAPMVCDMHHLFSSPSKLNNRRSNYPFKEMEYSQCAEFCKDNTCSSSYPANPEEYSCLGKDKKSWMPRAADKGEVARAVLYFFTMYDMVDMDKVGSLETFKQWNRDYPPSAREKARNEQVNISQGNRNPYIDDYTLVDQAW